MSTLKLIALVPVLLLLAACYKKQPVKVQEKTNSTEITTYNGVMEIQKLTMPDGTVCVVLIGSYAGGISCNWSKPIE